MNILNKVRKSFKILGGIFVEVVIFFGSKFDIEVMKGVVNVLKEFGVIYKVFVLLVYRVLEKLEEILKEVEEVGC